MNLDYKEKYLKYKSKYLLTKSHQGGIGDTIQKTTLYANLLQFFTTTNNTKNYVTIAFSDIFEDETIVLKIFQTKLFKSKLLILWAILIGNSEIPKLFTSDKTEFFKSALYILVFEEHLTLEEFNKKIK